jgi:membrane protease subunit HflK
MIRRLLIVAPILALVAYGVSGLQIVAPGEVGVVRRLGRVQPTSWSPGLHLGWPRGLDRVTRVRVDEVRRLTVGLDDADAASGTGEYLTGDLNLIRAQAIVQYRVADPAAFVTRAEAVEPILTRMAEASLARALASQTIDFTLKDGRTAAATSARAFLEQEARSARLGIAVLGVSLTDARPPAEVAADFAAAQSARSEHDRRVNEARSYAVTSRTKADAEATRQLEAAHARADRAIALARSKAGRFLTLLAETEKARALTVRRIYLDALRELLPRVRRKLVLGADEVLDLSILEGGK